MPESTEGQVAKVEEELDESRLVDLRDNAEKHESQFSKLKVLPELKQAKKKHATLLENYFGSRREIARGVLQFRINVELEQLKEHGRRRQLDEWLTCGEAKLDRKRLKYYWSKETREQTTSKIERARSFIAQNVVEIREALLAFDLDANFPLWPILTTDGNEIFAEFLALDYESPSGTDVVVSSGASGVKGSGSAGAASSGQSEKSEDGTLQQFLEGHISILIATGSKVTYEAVAARIPVGRMKSDKLLPQSFQDRIISTELKGTLLEFIEDEEKKNGPIDFRTRFMKLVSKAKCAREKRIKAASQSKI